jgi:nudix motif 8
MYIVRNKMPTHLKQSKLLARESQKLKELLCSHKPFLKILPDNIKTKIVPHTKSKSSLKASVLVPIVHIANNQAPSILFTRRSSTLKNHPNEICFPGGHIDEGEACLLQTAIRETKEELSPQSGYDMDHGLVIIGRTDDIPSARLIPVTPFVGYFREVFTEDDIQNIFPGNKSEVAHVFTVSLDELIETEGSEPLARLMIDGPVYKTSKGKIWGLTALVLKRIIDEILSPIFFKKKEKEVGIYEI